jgi:hypothetical protein
MMRQELMEVKQAMNISNSRVKNMLDAVHTEIKTQ